MDRPPDYIEDLLKTTTSVKFHSFTKRSFFKRKVRVKTKAARRANLLRRKNK